MGQENHRIEMHFQQMMEKAEELLTLANELSHVADRDIISINEHVRSGWTGNSADVYQKKIEKLYNQVLAQAAGLRATAGILQGSAKVLYNIERKGMEIFGKKG